MQPIQHPDTIRLIHDDMVSDEMSRDGRRPLRQTDRPAPGPGDGVRAAIGKALIALGTRIEPRRSRLDRPASAPR